MKQKNCEVCGEVYAGELEAHINERHTGQEGMKRMRAHRAYLINSAEDKARCESEYDKQEREKAEKEKETAAREARFEREQRRSQRISEAAKLVREAKERFDFARQAVELEAEEAFKDEVFAKDAEDLIKLRDQLIGLERKARMKERQLSELALAHDKIRKECGIG